MTCNTPPGVWERDVPSAAWSQPDPTSCSQLGYDLPAPCSKEVSVPEQFQIHGQQGGKRKVLLLLRILLPLLFLSFFFGGGLEEPPHLILQPPSATNYNEYPKCPESKGRRGFPMLVVFSQRSHLYACVFCTASSTVFKLPSLIQTSPPVCLFFLPAEAPSPWLSGLLIPL